MLDAIARGESVNQISAAVGDAVSRRTIDRRVREIVRAGHLDVAARLEFPASANEAHPQVSGVYFVQCVDRIKIGWSKDISARLADDTFCPYPPVLLAWLPGATVMQERELHHTFRDLRTHREWFRAESPLTDFLTGAQCPESASS